MSATRQEVYRAIDGERAYQQLKWKHPVSTGDNGHSLGEWFMYLDDYSMQAKHALTRLPDEQGNQLALETLRKIAAMCVAAMEQHGAPVRDLDHPIEYTL